MKKNCNNCKHGEWDGHFDELSHTYIDYFICYKRDIDEPNLEKNLERAEYREKAKRCHEPKAV